MQAQNLSNIVCFYSKFSTHSKSLIHTAKSFKELDLIRYISVDSKEIRNIIGNDKIYSISSVPCIFLVYNKNFVEKFEGIDAQKWLHEVIHNIKQPLDTAIFTIGSVQGIKNDVWFGI